MNAAIAVTTLFFGGLVLNSPTEEQRTNMARPVVVAETSEAPAAAAPAPSGTVRRDREYDDSRSQARTRSAAGTQTAPAPAEQGTLDDVIAPTDSPLGDEESSAQPKPPTSNTPLPQGMGAGYGRSISRAPTSPAARRGAQQQAGSRLSSSSRTRSFGGTMNQQVQPGQTGTASFMVPPGMTGTGPNEKAFSGYQAPSGVSPWMNLFRRDSLGTIDNYTTLVRPQMEQQYMNRQFGREISGLERHNRIQQMNMQRLDQAERAPQSVATPQYYLNYPGAYEMDMSGQAQAQGQ